MKCPVCSTEMVEKDLGQKVDICENGCKGIWFDRAELQKLDQPGEGIAAAIKAAQQSPRINDAERGQINCPQCGIPMHMHKFARDQEVNVDECYECGGFFLDSGELKEIRDNFMSDTDAEAYTEKLADGIPGYVAGGARHLQQKERIKAIQNFTSMIGLNIWTKHLN